VEGMFDFVDTRDLFLALEPLARSYKPTQRGASILSRLYQECNRDQKSTLHSLAPYAVGVAKQHLG